MPNTRIPSPARSQGPPVTPRCYKTRKTRSVGSPARSTASGRLSNIVDQFKEKNQDSFAASPLSKTILSDNTEIDMPRRQSWWKKVENSRDMIAVLEDEKVAGPANVLEEFDMESLCQEKENCTIDLPESSDNESIKSIVVPQRRLFVQKQNQPQLKFGDVVSTSSGNNTQPEDKTIHAGTKNLFSKTSQLPKPVFPSALLNITAETTLTNKTKELPEDVKAQPKVLFGRPATKRKNMFADFVFASESEDEIPEIVPKRFTFHKPSEPSRRSSNASSVTTDIDMDDWKLLPSSTMVEHQLEAGLTPGKRARLSKLSEAKESTNTDSTKQSNKSMSKNKSKLSPAKNQDAEMSLKETTQKHNTSQNRSKTFNKTKNISQAQDIGTTANEEAKETSTVKNKTYNINQTTDKQVSKSQIVENVEDVQISDKTELTEKQNASQNKSKTCNKTKNISQAQDIGSTANEEAKETSTVKNKTYNINKTTDEQPVATTEENVQIEELAQVSGQEDVAMNENVPEKASEESEQDQAEASEEIKASEQDGTDAEQELEADYDDEEAEQKEKETEEQIEASQEKIKNNDQTDEQQNATQEMEEEEEIELNYEEDAENNEEGVIQESADVDQNESQTNEEELQDKCVEVGKQARLSKLSEAKESPNTDSTKQSNKSMSSKNNSKLSPAKNQDAEMSVKETTHTQNTSQNKSKTFNKSKNISQAQDYGTTANEEVKETSTVKNKTYNVNQTTDEQPVATTEENVQIEKLAQVSGQEDEAMDENIPEKKASEDQLETSDQDQAEASQEIEASDQEGTDAEQELEADDDNDDDEQQVNDEEEEEQEEDKEETDEHIEPSQEEMESNDEIDEDQNASQEMEEEKEEIENNDEIDEEQNAMEDEQEVEQDDEEDAEVDNDELHESDDVAQNASQANEEEVQNEIEEEEAQDESEDESDYQNESQEMEEEQENEEIDDEEEQNESQEAEEVEEEDQEMEEDVIEASEEMQEDEPETEQQQIEGNVTHDTTGRNRKKRETNTPEAILHDATNEMESFIAKGRNTSIRKTSLKNFTIRPSLAPARESTGLSDGTKNSSAEGSGWDSHRTTRKTLRQTFGKDFTPRKSLRALVMEKSAKRQTQINEANEALRHQANSTEIPNDHEEMDYENMEPETDHEVSRRTRQTTLEMYLQKIKKENMEFKQKIEQQVKNSFKSNPVRVDILNFKPNKLTIRRMNAKSLQTAPKIKRVKSSVINLENLPQEFIEDMKYKPPKRFKPANASWITKRLYKFLESKLEPKYDYKARVRAEKLVQTIYNFVRETRRARVAPPHLVAELQREMARLDVVKTYFEFYSFFGEYLPTEVKIKVVPDIVNDIPLPSGGVFADIMV